LNTISYGRQPGGQAPTKENKGRSSGSQSICPLAITDKWEWIVSALEVIKKGEMSGVLYYVTVGAFIFSCLPAVINSIAALVYR